MNSVGRDKERHTVLLGETMTGEKLRALMIYKGKGIKTVKNVHQNVKVGFKEANFWMHRENIGLYIRHVIRYCVEDLPRDKRGLLFIDNYEEHIDTDIK